MAQTTAAAPLGGVESLDEARERTLRLIAPVQAGDLDHVHDPLMSPLSWDLGHIAAYEDLWLNMRGGGHEPLRPDLMEVYDATETPRADRGDLPYLRSDEALGYMDAVRARSRESGAAADFVELVLQHEHQHNETMLQALALAAAGVYAPERRPLPQAPSQARCRHGARRRRALPRGRPRRRASCTTTSARSTRWTCPRSRSTGCR